MYVFTPGTLRTPGPKEKVEVYGKGRICRLLTKAISITPADAVGISIWVDRKDYSSANRYSVYSPTGHINLYSFHRIFPSIKCSCRLNPVLWTLENGSYRGHWVGKDNGTVLSDLETAQFSFEPPVDKMLTGYFCESINREPDHIKHSIALLWCITRKELFLATFIQKI